MPAEPNGIDQPGEDSNGASGEFHSGIDTRSPDAWAVAASTLYRHLPRARTAAALEA